MEHCQLAAIVWDGAQFLVVQDGHKALQLERAQLVLPRHLQQVGRTRMAAHVRHIGHIPAAPTNHAKGGGIYPPHCNVGRAQGESSGRNWGTGHRVRKGEGSLGC
eukprot:335625-Prorocentrum_minimum.AAC.1